MLKLCFKIWLVANLLVLAVISFLTLPHAMVFALLAFGYSCLFSLPAIIILYYLLVALRWMRGGIWFSWGGLLAGTSLVSFLAYTLFHVFVRDAQELDFILPLSFVSGFSAVVFFSQVIHYLFQTFQYGNYEND